MSGLAGAGFGCVSTLISKGTALPALLILKVYEYSCGIAGRLPLSEVYTGAIGFKRIFLMILCILGIHFLAKKHMIKQTVVLLSVILVIILPFKSEKLKIAHLYVGQGDCCVITYGEYAVLIDCGSSDKKNIYKYTVESYLNYMGYEYPNYIFLSHSDEDHVNGLTEEIFTDKGSDVKIIIPDLNDDSGFDKIRMNVSEIIKISQGEKAEIANMTFTCLYPREGNNEESSNDTSMVLLFEYGDFKELFMGDLPMEKESLVVDEMKNMKIDSVNVIKVGHHGSKTSTGEEFLNYIKPDIAVISCGIDNSYAHPHKETIQNLEYYGVEVLRTDENGECSISLRKDYNVIHSTYVH